MTILLLRAKQKVKLSDLFYFKPVILAQGRGGGLQGLGLPSKMLGVLKTKTPKTPSK